MIGVYFSGTGNSKYCVEKFLQEYCGSKCVFSIEQDKTLEKIVNSKNVVISYPVQFSNIPKMCYRCINKCPKQAITLLGTKVIEQYNIDQYL